VAIEVEVGSLLSERGLTLATAESCTGGLLAHRVTNVPGSSAYFLGGFVTYADEAKQVLLGVQEETLRTYGAVSGETAEEMARGASARLGADVAVSVTGIAGPTGGSLEKPVGLTYVALTAGDIEWCQRFVWSGDRLANKDASVEAALQLVRRYLVEGGA
jgi:PncC family amidohydrolase